MGSVALLYLPLIIINDNENPSCKVKLLHANANHTDDVPERED